MNFSEALSSCSHPPAAVKIKKMRDRNRKDRIIQDQEKGTQKERAMKHGCSVRWYQRVLHNAKQAPKIREHWYVKLMDEAVRKIDPDDTDLDRPTSFTTNLKEDIEPAEISEAVLANHRFQGKTMPDVKQYARNRIVKETSKGDFQGFFVVDTMAEDEGIVTLKKEDRDKLDKILHKELPELVRGDEEYFNRFSPIFEFAQQVPLTQGAKRGSVDEEDDKRMGDKQRLQAKLSDLMGVAARRTREYEQDAKKRGKNGRKAQNKLKQATKEDELLTDLYNLLCANYECIRMVWPESVRKDDDDAANYAIILSLPGARRQGIHADSVKRGFSILTAMEREQHVVVLLHGFRAMRICNELNADRPAATSLFRERLKNLPQGEGRRIFSDKAWNDRFEPRVWHALVHLEFEARGLPYFEAVLVPISKGASIVIDTRCLHGGGPGDGLTGFRAHAYGTVPDRSRAGSCDDALDKDYLATVDILKDVYYPVGTWGKRSGLWG